jgi:S-adenosyl-L-methionine hydrolase (adenosine-forming)
VNGDPTAPIITLLTDFGLADPSVGACRGVLSTIAPGVPLADIGHEVPDFDIEAGARMLEYAVPYYPPGSIHVGVVDPGVGSARRGIAVRAGRGDVLVGPDNGLLLWAADRLGGVEQAVELTAEQYRLHPTSHTFHARDVFCPAAGHLATGVALDKFGPALDPRQLVRLPRQEPYVGQHEVRAAVSHIASFGNVHFNVLADHWQAAGLEGERRIEVSADGRRWEIPYALTFADVQPGKALLLHDSFGRLCLAVNQGSAAAAFGLARGSEVRFTSLR